MRVTRLGELQLAGLEIYVFDPAVVDGAEALGEPAFPGTLNGTTLTVTDQALARRLLHEAAESAESDGDKPIVRALSALAERVGGSKQFQSRSNGVPCIICGDVVPDGVLPRNAHRACMDAVLAKSKER